MQHADNYRIDFLITQITLHFQVKIHQYNKAITRNLIGRNLQRLEKV